jgi:hypothetical protein
MTGRPAPLEVRFWAKVDKTKDCWNWTASRGTAGYGQIGIGGRYGRPHLAHRVAYELEIGPIPDGMQVDHICHNRICVNPSHLRLATNKENNEHRAGLQRNNTSGYNGVTKRSDCNRYAAQITHNGNHIYVGLFESAEEANAAVTAKRLELFTHNDLDRLAA